MFVANGEDTEGATWSNGSESYALALSLQTTLPNLIERMLCGSVSSEGSEHAISFFLGASLDRVLLVVPGSQRQLYLGTESFLVRVRDP